MMRFWQSAWRCLRELCFPPKCSACHTLLDWRAPLECCEERGALCDDCLRAWRSETLETCGICARRVADCTCQPMLMTEAKCKGLCKAVYYQPRIASSVPNRIIYSLKQRHDRKAVHFLTAETSGTVEAVLAREKLARETVLVTYLPRSRRAVLTHGIDQAEVLARALARSLNLPYAPLIERRRGANLAQKDLTEAERVENAKHAFCVGKDADCRKKTVLLVDDVVTSGAGMAVGTRLLRKMGASCVIGVSVAVDAINKDL